MMKKNIILWTIISLLFCLTASAQNIITVDRKAQTDTLRQIFSDAKEALRYAERHWSADVPTEIRIAPGVYWLDDPDDTRILRPRKGSGIPYGMEVRMSNVTLIGTGETADDVILASQRGQTQGADGNFTMLHIDGDDISARNITFGNYCNVDLVYPRDPSQNRKKKADAIVQAQLVICNGDRYTIDNCRFISRLNLCPFAGARHILFRNCYFESTDDALAGTGVYIGCKFLFFSGKPFYSTSRQGAVLVDCDIHSKVHGNQYLSKVPSPFFLIDCRFTSDDPNLHIGWTSVPGEMLRCYQSNVTLNGKSITIGSSPNTVDITGTPLLGEFRRKLSNITSAELQYLPTPLYAVNPEITTEADIETTEDHYLTARALDGRESVTHLRILPSLLPAPEIIKPLKLKRKGNTLTANYKLNLEGHSDASDLLWFRTRNSDSILVQTGGTEYVTTDADKGWTIACKLIPKTNRSTRERNKHLCEYRQDRILPGFWTYDTFKPSDTSEYDWQPDPKSSGWTWGKGVDGAADAEGYVQVSKGARMMFTPTGQHTGNMSVTINCTPCKSAGQGFGSATGQYMDIAVKMNNETLTGYALRLRRTPYLDKAVEAVLMEYDNGTTREICNPIVTQNFKGDCTITVSIEGNAMRASVTKDDSGMTDTLTADVKTSSEGGFMLQHTGSTGASATVIRSIMMEK